jgi:hypothetical protein
MKKLGDLIVFAVVYAVACAVAVKLLIGTCNITYCQ